MVLCRVEVGRGGEERWCRSWLELERVPSKLMRLYVLDVVSSVEEERMGSAEVAEVGVGVVVVDGLLVEVDLPAHGYTYNPPGNLRIPASA
jgi:hypothetical protein